MTLKTKKMSIQAISQTVLQLQRKRIKTVKAGGEIFKY